MAIAVTTDREGSPNAWGVGQQFQRGTFVAAGRDWLIYADGTSLYHTSSDDDGSTWSTPTAFRSMTEYGVNNGIAHCDFHFDGTYVHYVVAGEAISADLYYRRGTPNSDGTITWSAAEQTVFSGASSSVLEVGIDTDSNGVPWITYEDYGASINGFPLPYVTRATSADGTWATQSGYPLELIPYDAHWWTGIVRENGSGDMRVFFWHDLEDLSSGFPAWEYWPTSPSEPTWTIASRVIGGSDEFVDEEPIKKGAGGGFIPNNAYVSDGAGRAWFVFAYGFGLGMRVWSSEDQTTNHFSIEMDTCAVGYDTASGDLVVVYTNASNDTSVRMRRFDPDARTMSSETVLETISGVIRPSSLQITERGNRLLVAFQETASGEDNIHVFALASAGDTYDKAGMGVMGIPGSSTYDKAGQSVSNRVASGLSSETYAEAGTSVASRESAGLDSITLTELDTGVVPRVANGTDAITSTELGQGTLARVASGAKASVVSKTGSATFTSTGNGSDSVTSTEAGGVTTSFRAEGSGTTSLTFVKSGTAILGISPFESGLATMTLSASGSKQVSTNKQGLASTGLVASGVKEHLAPSTFIKQGGGAGGAGSPAYGLLSLSLAPGLRASGAKLAEHPRVTIGVLDLTTQGIDSVILDERNTAEIVRVASATRSVIVTKAGTSLGSREAAGAKATTHSEAGTGINSRVGSGSRATNAIFDKSGVGISERIVSGADSASLVKFGEARLSFSGDGSWASTVIYEKTGGAVRPVAAQGFDSTSYIELGLVETGRSANGFEIQVFSESGTSSTRLDAEGVARRERQRFGNGQFTLLASGLKVIAPGQIIFTKAGEGNTSLIASGEDSARIERSGGASVSFRAQGLRGQETKTRRHYIRADMRKRVLRTN